MYRVGSKVRMSEDALSNYGEKWRGKILTVTHAATKYMPAKEFFAKGKPEGYHPGFDESSGSPLYSLVESNGKSLSMDLYGWELEGVHRR